MSGAKMILFTTLKRDIDNIRKLLVKKQANFDKILLKSNEVIRHSGELITMLHNIGSSSEKEIKTSLKSLQAQVQNLQKIDKGMEYYTLQAYQEYAEARLLFEIKINNKFLSNSSFRIKPEAYLLGILDLVGELNREFIESLRKNKIKEAEEYLNMMTQIYDLTRSLRFSSALISDLRKKQDVSRILVERASSEFMLFTSNR
jgi:translin